MVIVPSAYFSLRGSKRPLPNSSLHRSLSYQYQTSISIIYRGNPLPAPSTVPLIKHFSGPATMQTGYSYARVDLRICGIEGNLVVVAIGI